jgi:hypothetical protein
MRNTFKSNPCIEGSIRIYRPGDIFKLDVTLLRV